MSTILAISGSLREASINTKLLTAIASTAPAGLKFSLYRDLGSLPLFNPDLEGIRLPSVQNFRSELASCDGLLISSPEYARGIPGAMKNALDWVVGSGELVGKPVAVLNAAPRSSVAYEALKVVLRTVDACLVSEASLDIPVMGKDLDAAGLLRDPVTGPLIARVLPALLAAIESERDQSRSA